MQVPRLPRRLRYRWSDGGVETEYSADIPTPPPEIKCDTVQVTVPPSLPASFYLYATKVFGTTYTPNTYVISLISYSMPSIVVTSTTFFAGAGNLDKLGIRGTNQFGQVAQANDSFYHYQPGTAYLTPGGTQKPRRDLLVGADRIQNPTLEAPCPTWRFTGGNCPEGSLDCGNCCLDCAGVKAGIEGITASVLPYSTWRKP